MPVLPDYQALGERPVPRAGGGVVGYDPEVGKTAQQAGVMVGRASNELNDAALVVAAASDRQDRIIALDAANRLNAAALDIERNPETGFVNARGGKVVDPEFVKSYTQRLDEQRASIEQGLTSESQKREFGRHAQVSGLRFQSALLQHKARETLVYNAQTRENRINVFMNDIAAHPGDDLAYEANLRQIGDVILQEADERGFKGDSKAAFIDVTARKLQSKALVYRIQGTLLSDGVKAASDLFNRANPSDFDGNDRAQIGLQLKTQMIAQRSSEDGKRAMQIGTSSTPSGVVDYKADFVKPIVAERIAPVLDLVNKPSPYDAYFAAASKKYGVPVSELKLRAAVESGMNPNAVSPAGAVGLMQFMPKMVAAMGIDPKDPAQAIEAAASLMAGAGGTVGGDMSKVDRLYYGGSMKANGPNTNQYTENMRVLRAALYGQAQAPATIAGLEGSLGEVEANARSIARISYPGDSVYEEHVVNEARRHLSDSVNILKAREYETASRILGQSVGPTGIKSLSQLSPDDQKAFTQLSPEKQHSLYNLWHSNSTTGAAENPDNTRAYLALMGRAVNDPIGFKSLDIAAQIKDLPKNFQSTVLAAYVSIDKEAAKGPLYTRVLNDPQVAQMIRNAGIKKPTDKTGESDRQNYDLLTGQVIQSVDNYIGANGKQPTQKEYMAMVANLIASVKVPGMFWGTNDKKTFEVKPGEEVVIDGKVVVKPKWTAEAPAKPITTEDFAKLGSGDAFINPKDGRLLFKK